MSSEVVRGQLFEVGPRYTGLQYIGEGGKFQVTTALLFIHYIKRTYLFYL